MQQQQDPPRSGTRVRLAGSSRHAPDPQCQGCQRRMSVKQVSPVLFASEMDDVIYRCDGCGAETKRTVKRS
jgi:DNA-directed RNA polymerase subunit RPC12/RpoP